ncbi:hypothetical protein GCM10009563_23810 [Subtercola frigoramans]
MAIWYWYYDAGAWTPLDYDAKITTDAAGNFVLPVGDQDTVAIEYHYLGAGNFVSKPYVDDWVIKPTDSRVLHLTQSVTATTVVLAVGGRISGMARGTGGQPLGGLLVEAVPKKDDPGNYDSHVTTTKADGSYSFMGLQADRYSVIFSGGGDADEWYFSQMPGSDAFNREGAGPVKVAVGESKAGLDATLTAGAIVNAPVSCLTCLSSGTVRVSLDILNPSTKLWVRASGDLFTADFARFTDLYPGTYRATFHYEGPEAYDDVTVAPFALTEGQTYDLPYVNLTQKPVAAVGVSAPVRAFITALYFDYLARRPSTDEVAFWGAQLAHGSGSGVIASAFAQSDEYRLDCIDAAYKKVLGRAPDPGGRQFWLDRMHKGLSTTDDILKSFYASEELAHRRGTWSWVSALYQFILGRYSTSGDDTNWIAAGRAYAQAHGEAGNSYADGADAYWVVDQIYESREAATDRVRDMYDQYLGRHWPGDSELAFWAPLDQRYGDSIVRGGFTGSAEY